MKYNLELQFKGKPRCKMCMLSTIKNIPLSHETFTTCYALSNNPVCPENGCCLNCPLEEKL